MQSAMKLVFPPSCLACGELVETEFALCGRCWRETRFITGLVCDTCGVPLPGEDAGTTEHCDDCMTIARPWERGRAALIYRDTGRRLVLALKHGDRLDIARPAANWMVRAAAAIATPDALVVPIPAHRFRLLKRRYNQAAMLAGCVARRMGLQSCPDALIRHTMTRVQDGMTRDERFANMAGAIRAHPRRTTLMQGRPVLLVDDVMTSGATFAAATEACLEAGATKVDVLALARVAKDA